MDVTTGFSSSEWFRNNLDRLSNGTLKWLYRGKRRCRQDFSTWPPGSQSPKVLTSILLRLWKSLRHGAKISTVKMVCRRVVGGRTREMTLEHFFEGVGFLNCRSAWSIQHFESHNNVIRQHENFIPPRQPLFDLFWELAVKSRFAHRVAFRRRILYLKDADPLPEHHPHSSSKAYYLPIMACDPTPFYADSLEPLSAFQTRHTAMTIPPSWRTLKRREKSPSPTNNSKSWLISFFRQTWSRTQNPTYTGSTRLCRQLRPPRSIQFGELLKSTYHRSMLWENPVLTLD